MQQRRGEDGFRGDHAFEPGELALVVGVGRAFDEETVDKSAGEAHPHAYAG